MILLLEKEIIILMFLIQLILIKANLEEDYNDKCSF